MNNSNIGENLRTFNFEFLIRKEQYFRLLIGNSDILNNFFCDIKEQSLRVLRDNKIGFSYLVGNNDEQEMIKNCMESIPYGDDKRSCFFGSEKEGKISLIEHKKVIDNKDIFINDSLSLRDSIILDRKKYLDVEVDARLFSISTYVESNYSTKVFNINKVIFDIRIKNIINGAIYRENLNSFSDLEKLDDLIDRIGITRTGYKINNTNLITIFNPKIVRNLILPIWKMYSKSTTGGKVNFALLNLISEDIIISDNPKSLASPNFIPFDHTGKSTREELIFDKSSYEKKFRYQEDYCNVFKNNYLTRNFDITSLPQKYPTSLEMKSGNIEFDEFIKNTNNGIYIINSLNLWQNISPSGDFKGLIDEGFIIQNGKKIGMAKGLCFSGNIFDVLGKDLEGISKEKIRLGYYSDNLPYIFCKHVQIE